MRKIVLVIVISLVLSKSENAYSQIKVGGLDSCLLRLKTLEMLFLSVKDTNISIGIFESPQIRDHIRTLKSGIIPELGNNYIETILKYNLLKLNSIKSIRGDFDSVIFLRQPSISSNIDFERTAFYFSNTKWLLFLDKTINKNGIYTQDWLLNLYFDSDKKVFNKSTVYNEHFGRQNPICLNWAAKQRHPYGLEFKSESFCNELQKVINANDKLDKTARLTELNKLLKQKEIQDKCIIVLLKLLIADYSINV